MNIQLTIEFKDHRCDECGAYWAIESARNYTDVLQCPLCATRKVNEANDRVAEMERSMRALKANFTRLKARNK